VALNFFERIRRDNKRILKTEMFPITLYNASGDSQAGQVRFTSPALSINPQGLQIVSEKISIAFSVSSFSEITGANENYKGWQAELEIIEGQLLRLKLENIHFDKTFGYVLSTLKKIKGA